MIYRFKVTSDAMTGFFRNYELREKNTLYDLHEHIVNDLHFAPDQMVLFRVENTAGKATKEYGLFNTGHGSMDEVRIEQLIKRKETALLYVFDIRYNRSLRVKFLEKDEELPRKSYPNTSDGKGDAPPQFHRPAKKSLPALDISFEDELDESDIEGLLNE